MKLKMVIVFILIVTMPIAIIIWLGITLAQKEESTLEQKVNKVYEARLRDIDKNIVNTLKKKEIELLPILEDDYEEMDDYRSAIRKTPLINQIFILNKKRKLVYPLLSTDNLNQSEKEFLERTKEIWESGISFEQKHEENIVTQKTLSNYYNIQSQQALNTGWFTWVQGQGTNFIFWLKNDYKFIGVEINRARLISDIFNSLPTNEANEEQLFVLHNNLQELYIWGNYERSKGEKPTVEISLSPPLQDWRLAVYGTKLDSVETFKKTMFLNYTFGGIMLVSLLSLLIFYFYRENSRQLRESSTKVNFVNQVSHELKTPLTNIRLYAELLETHLSEENEKATQQLKVITNESQRLSRLINNVLTFAKQEKKKLSLNKKLIVIDEIILGVLQSFKPILEKKMISSVIKLNAKTEIKADPDAIEQIIGNLLSNIEKYVQNKGEVKISSYQTDSKVIITVSDNGPGIPKNQQKKIFAAFHRISNNLSDGVSGTGIGLSISKELAQLHGGDLELIESEKGATFQLTLPKER